LRKLLLGKPWSPLTSSALSGKWNYFGRVNSLTFADVYDNIPQIIGQKTVTFRTCSQEPDFV